MSNFQIAGLVMVAALTLLTAGAWMKGWISRKDGILWSAIFIIAGLAMAMPDMTTRVAKLVGIGRGADLMLYCSIIVMMIGFFMVYVRLRRLRRDMTLLVRRLAIYEGMRQAETRESR